MQKLSRVVQFIEMRGCTTSVLLRDRVTIKLDFVLFNQLDDFALQNLSLGLFYLLLINTLLDRLYNLSAFDHHHVVGIFYVSLKLLYELNLLIEQCNSIVNLFEYLVPSHHKFISFF